MDTITTLDTGHDGAYYATIAAGAAPRHAKTGRRRPRTRPRLHASRYFASAADTTMHSMRVPPAVHRSDRAWKRSPLGNAPDPGVSHPIVSKYGAGCCLPAAFMHRIQHAYIMAGKTPPPFTSDECLALYAILGDYDITQTAEDGTNPTDKGCDPTVCFEHWRVEGVVLPDGSVDKILDHMEVDPNDPTQWERCVYEFDGAFRGYEMPASAQGQPVWTVVDPTLTGDAEPGSWGGHETYEVSYDPLRAADESWGEVRLVDRRFGRVYTDQLTVVLNEDILNRSGISPSGFNYDLLHADLDLL